MLLIKYSAAQAFTKAFYRSTHGWQGIRRPASKNQALMGFVLGNGRPASWKEGGHWGIVTWEI
jgi:hypothetical protein